MPQAQSQQARQLRSRVRACRPGAPAQLAGHRAGRLRQSRLERHHKLPCLVPGTQSSRKADRPDTGSHRRHRPHPRPDLRPDARPGPARPRHQRRHRRTARRRPRSWTGLTPVMPAPYCWRYCPGPWPNSPGAGPIWRGPRARPAAPCMPRWRKFPPSPGRAMPGMDPVRQAARYPRRPPRMGMRVHALRSRRTLRSSRATARYRCAG